MPDGTTPWRPQHRCISPWSGVSLHRGVGPGLRRLAGASGVRAPGEVEGVSAGGGAGLETAAHASLSDGWVFGRDSLLVLARCVRSRP
jgi:hypothetical protein